MKKLGLFLLVFDKIIKVKHIIRLLTALLIPRFVIGGHSLYSAAWAQGWPHRSLCRSLDKATLKGESLMIHKKARMLNLWIFPKFLLFLLQIWLSHCCLHNMNLCPLKHCERTHQSYLPMLIDSLTSKRTPFPSDILLFYLALTQQQTLYRSSENLSCWCVSNLFSCSLLPSQTFLFCWLLVLRRPLF